MTNGVCGTGEEVGLAKPPEHPDPWALAAHVAGGRSPFDFVEPPIWFSYSSFETFDRCPRQYAFRYLCHLPAEEPRPAAEFGSAAHGAFAAFTRERRERPARGEPGPDRADLERFFESTWARTSLSAEADAETWRRRAEPMLDRFWASESAPQPETVGEELRFRLGLQLDPDVFVVVTGYIDRVDRLPSGTVELIDYKSGPSASREAAEASMQLDIRPRVPRRARSGPARTGHLLLRRGGPALQRRAYRRRARCPAHRSCGSRRPDPRRRFLPCSEPAFLQLVRLHSAVPGERALA